MIDDDLLRDDEAEVSVGSTFDEEYCKSKHVGFSATAIFTGIGQQPRRCTIERIIGEIDDVLLRDDDVEVVVGIFFLTNYTSNRETLHSQRKPFFTSIGK